MNRLANITPKMASNVQARVASIDIERIPGWAKVQHRGFTIVGPFWDLGALKPMIGRRIHPDDVVSWPRTICAAMKPYGTDETEFASVWDDGDEGFLRKVWDWHNDADIVTGHNYIGFDVKHLRSDWLEHGLGEPSPFKIVDTLKVARRAFGFESNTLDALCKRLGVPAKTDKYDVKVAHAAVGGDKEAQQRIQEYNEGDVIATEGLMDKLRPYITEVHLGQYVAPDENGDVRACPACGSTNITYQDGKTAKANIQVYRLYHCDHCGAWARGTTKLINPIQTRSTR